MYINISIPLQITRATLYLVIASVSILLILLPFSIVSYLKFYNTLIPDAILKRSLNLNYEFRNRGPYIIINSNEFVSRLANINDNFGRDFYFTKEGLSHFELNLNLKYDYLPIVSRTSPDTLVGLRFSILDDSILNSELHPWELDLNLIEQKSKFVKLWPITDNLRRSLIFNSNSNYLETDEFIWPSERSLALTQATPPEQHTSIWNFWPIKDQEFYSSSLANNIYGGTGGGNTVFDNGVYFTTTKYFSAKTIVTESNSLIPSFFKPLTPSIFHDAFNFEKVISINLSHLIFKNLKNSKMILQNSKNIKFIIELNNSNLYFSNVELEFIVKFSGLRYYMYHYKLSCFFIGCLMFWAVSSLTCLFFSITLFWYFTSKPSTTKSNTDDDDSDTLSVKIKKESNQDNDDSENITVKKESVVTIKKEDDDYDDRQILKNLDNLLQE